MTLQFGPNSRLCVHASLSYAGAPMRNCIKRRPEDAQRLGFDQPVGRRQSCRPCGGACCCLNPVLADLDHDTGQSATLAVHRDRVVDIIVDRVGRVVPDGEFPAAGEHAEHQRGESRVAPMGNADMPGPWLAVQNRREAVNTKQQTRPPGTGIEQPIDGIMVRLEQRCDAALSFQWRQSAIARDGHAVTLFGNGSRAAQRSITVDDETRVAAQYQGCIEKS